MSLFIHVGGRVVHGPTPRPLVKPRLTLDKDSLPSLYADLTERFWAVIQTVMGKAPTKDDKEGHEFHGNQWTGGIGGKPKPTTIKAKGGKSGLHELLSSGYPFTKAELMAITGITLEKTFSDAIAMLKNPKWAGKAGALQIVKNKDGTYQVMLADGNPAPAVVKIEPPLVEEPWPAAMTENLAASNELDALIKKSTKPDDELDAAWATMTPAQQVNAGKDPFSPEILAALNANMNVQHPVPLVVPAEPMGTSEKDAAYEAAVKKAQTNLKYALLINEADETLTKVLQDQLLLTFKQAKVQAMTQWSVNGTGKMKTATLPTQLFKADQMLAADILKAGSFGVTSAFADWKKNTQLEKAGQLGVEAKPKAKPAAVPKPDLVKDWAAKKFTGAVDVAPIAYASLVPKGFKQIDADAFTAFTAKGFATGITTLKTTLASESQSAAGNKQTVEQKLHDLLHDKPNFQQLVKASGKPTTGSSSLQASMISTWAGSSGDGNPLSCAMQLAVQDAFSLPEQHVNKKNLISIPQHGSIKGLHTAAASHLDMSIKTAEEIKIFRHGLQEFVQAQYHATQALFKEQGIKEVFLTRGMKFDAVHDPKLGPRPIQLQPASSFSANYSTAKAFSAGHTVFLVKVPASQVLSTYMTGFGCTSEHEVTVLGHGDLKAYTVPGGFAKDAPGGKIGSATVAHAYIKGKLMGATAPTALEKYEASKA